ncbi:hypothetical protein ACF0H5_016652 [Mactra antiquata]
MSGYVGGLSPQQEETLGKFREAVKDVVKPTQGDQFLLRWLRARYFDLKKSEAMLREAVKWRKEIGADTILDDYKELEVIEKYRTGGILGFDKTGCPIYIDPYGLVDMKGLLRSVKKQDIMRKFVHVMETVDKICDEESKKKDMLIGELTLIYDLKEIGMRQLSKESIDMYLAIVDAAEKYYPEVLKRVFVINSPKIFPLIWSIVRPLLHENTAKKVVVLTNHYKEALKKEIDIDQLPACYGGTLTDPDGDPRCKQHICQGGMVPKEYYNQVLPHVDMTSSSIGRGSTLKLEYEVHKANSVIRYQFQTDDFDVGFGVYRKYTADKIKACDMETVLTTQRSNCHLVPEDGAVICDKPGIYVVRFDNTYSWTRSKKIYYTIEVLEPATEYEDKVGDDDSSSDDDEEFVMASGTTS